MVGDKARYRTIDSLRGFAAIAVVFFHLTGNIRQELSMWVPEIVMTIFSYGYLGVPVFFVISGFVIAQSIANANVNLKFAGNFALRRMIRLDPPYWASIIIAMVLLAMKNAMQVNEEPYPSFSTLAAHIFYLQDLLKIPPVISEVYWTLCLEVQFYLFFIFSAVLMSAIAPSKYWGKNLHFILILAFGVASILADYKLLKSMPAGFFLPYWHYFVTGIILSEVAKKTPYATFVFLFWLGFEVIMQISQPLRPYTIALIFCAAFVYLGLFFNALDRWLVYRPFLFLGYISYSLYLLHPDIGWKAISIGKTYYGLDMAWYQSAGVFAGGITISILAAWLLVVLIEQPSVRLAKKFKIKPVS